MEFGWEQETYRDAYCKAVYCAIDSRGCPDKEEMLKKVIRDHTGAKFVVLPKDEDGYIDHQSAGITEEAFESELQLKNFIFGQDSYFETDNDNH